MESVKGCTFLRLATLRTSLLATSSYISSIQISMYPKSGVQQVLQCSAPSIPAWNALVSGYVQQGQGHLALSCFEQMQKAGFSPNEITYTCALKACGKTGAIETGMQIHEEISYTGFLAKDVMLGNALVDMYAKCDAMEKAWEVLEDLPIRNTVSWNSLIAVFVRRGQSCNALNCFEYMQIEGNSPDRITLTCILKACGCVGDVQMANQIHDDIVREGLLKWDIALGNALVGMYVSCGLISRAQLVLEELPSRNVFSWNALIAGYAQEGHCFRALDCLVLMQTEGISPNAVTYTFILKVCGSIEATNEGEEIHEEIVRRGWLEKDMVLSNALMDMYAKFGMLAKAQRVLNELPERDAVSWNTLAAAYAHQGNGQDVINCYERMQSEGLSYDTVSFLCILNSCGNSGALVKGKQIHSEIRSTGLLEKTSVLGNALVDMYSKFGLLTEAQRVLKELPVQNIVAWSSLIAGYVQHDRCHDAINCFQLIRSKGLSPDTVTYMYMLKACASVRSIETGKKLHEEIARKGLLDKDTALGNALADMYIKWGMVAKAQEVVDKLPVRDVVSWNELITGYAQHGECQRALNCFEHMQREGLSPDEVSYICTLKACGMLGASERGEKIHSEIVNSGLLEKNVAIGNALVDMYAKCGALAKARHTLGGLPIRNTLTWNALLSGYVNRGQGQDALDCFQCMQDEGHAPDAITLTCISKACGHMEDVEKSHRIYESVVSYGLLGKDVALGNALIDMYVKCRVLTKAQQVFEELPVRDVVSWNALIAGNVQLHQDHHALSCYHQMQNEGLSPDTVTFVCILKACGSIGAIDMGKHVHDMITTESLFDDNGVVGNALVDMYAKCGRLVNAEEILEELPMRDVVTWNALISAYSQHEDASHEVFSCLTKMQNEGILPDSVTFLSILKACGSTGAIEKGKEIHEEVVRRGLLEKDMALGNAVVDMYAKCGMLTKSEQALEELPIRNAISWSALIAGYAQQGQGREALNSFQRMRNEGIDPDEVAWLCVLAAFCHSGHFKEAQILVRDMSIMPRLEHLTSMIVVLGDAGQFDRALSLITVSQTSDHPAVWLALLGSCRKWGNVELGRLAFDRAVELDVGCATAYVLMANVYAAAGLHEDADKVEAMRAQNISKQTFSSPESKGQGGWIDRQICLFV